jgi:hypothetical protein
VTRPSVGFVYLILVAVGVVAFFAWAAATPPLDAAWQITIDLESGARGRLDADERRLLQDALRRHPPLADNLVEGRSFGIISPNDRGHIDAKFAYLIRRSAADPKTVRVHAREDVRVRVRAGKTKAKGEATPDTPFVFTAPDDRFPQLIELRFPKKKRRNAVRVETVP